MDSEFSTTFHRILRRYYCRVFARWISAGNCQDDAYAHPDSDEFCRGFYTCVALYHLLPHGLVLIPGPDAVEKAVGLMMLGIILMVLLLRIFHFHQHDFSDEVGDFLHEHAHDHAHGSSESRLIGIGLGLGLHTVTEGIALGTSIRVGEIHGGEASLAGLGVFLAILLHKPLDAFSIIGLLQPTAIASVLVWQLISDSPCSARWWPC